MPLKSADLIDWFEAKGITTPFFKNQFPKKHPRLNPNGGPHRAYRLDLPTGGLGTETEGALDRPTFQILTRGVDGDDAEELAIEIDELLLDQRPGFWVGDSWVIGQERLGGPPAFVAIDDDDRVIRAATYWMRVSRKDARVSGSASLAGGGTLAAFWENV